MASSRTQDQTASSSAAAFDRRPPPELEDTAPFSLLNSLLSDMPDTVRYEPPAFHSEAEPPITVTRNGSPDPSERTKVRFTPAAERPMAVVEKPAPVVEKHEPVAEKPAPVTEKTETAAEKPETIGNGHGPLPLPRSFPKLGDALMPTPPDSPRPKTKPFSALRTPEKRDQGTAVPKPAPSKPNEDRSTWPRPNFRARPGKRSYDPINKALRIFESLEKVSPSEKPEPPVEEPKKKSIFEVFEKSSLYEKPKTTPEAKKVIFEAFERVSPIEKPKPPPEESKKDLADDEETVRVILPKEEMIPPAEAEPEPKAEPLPEAKPEPKTEQPEPKVEKIAKAEFISNEVKTATAKALETLTVAPPVAKVPVPLRRRRRRRVPMNPWTAKSTSPLAKAPDEHKQHIDDTLASLAKILESTLQTPVIPAPTAGTETASVTLKSSFDGDFTNTSQVKVKVKLVPRPLADRDLEPSTNLEKRDEFEMTAPKTLVAKDAPISPFTKVVRATISTAPPMAPGPVPFRVSPSSLGSAPPIREKVESTDQSPFSLSPALGNAPPPIDKKAEPSDKPTKPFASPFATALQKRASAPTTIGGRKTGPVSPKVTPIRPPEEESHAAADDTLPAPTYSFSSMGLPTGKGIPSASPPPPAQTAAPAPITAAPFQSQAPPIAAPLPPIPPDPEPLPEGEAMEQKTRKIRKKRRRGPDPEPRSWSFLTGVLAFVCVAFLLIYLYEIYHTLKGTPAQRSPIPQDAEAIIPEGAAEESPAVNLKEPIDSLVQFLAADSSSARLSFIAEDEDGLAQRMTDHHTAFPLMEGTQRKIVDGGTFPDTQREYVIVRLGWQDGKETNAWMIKDGNSDYRFSWYAFEQARNKLLRHYTESAWTGWTQFFIEIKPIDPATLPEGSALENLYYRVTTPEDPEFEAVGYVDGDSSMIPDFRKRFSSARSYNVIADLQRDSPLPDDERPLFRITRLLKASWDPSR